ncbi:IclR family transcriptional regulator [Nonomuraea rhizosphaerae]|uniref:IclR family transcriptional regulator n=1 Tax=Nonomuraea rhizosphaerae TaxID=2665663 RepID=UPI001C5DA0CC|nr:IclR family transcriptional regulator [Nonomuraea rhizosphaerae]
MTVDDEPDEAGGRRSHVQSIERAIFVLECFTDEEPVLGVAELSRRVGLSTSIVFRVAQTLCAHGFLERAPDSDGYRIGLRAFQVGMRYRLHNTLERAAGRPMRELADKFGYNVYLGVLDGDDVVYMSTVNGHGPIQVRVTVGSRLPAHTTAIGKVLLAALPDGPRRRARGPLSSLTPDTVTDPDVLAGQLREARTRGYALNRGEALRGVSSVAAPVTDHTGRTVAAVSNGFASHLVSEAEFPEIIDAVVGCASAISRRLGRDDGPDTEGEPLGRDDGPDTEEGPLGRGDGRGERR